ncbi:hypothetical protein ACO0SA_000383 [Hanseniaspora valbyensis]
MSRKNRKNDDLLLLNMINEKLSNTNESFNDDNDNSNTVKKNKKDKKKKNINIYQFVEPESEESDIELTPSISKSSTEIDNTSTPTPSSSKISLSSKKNKKKKNKKAKKQSSITNSINVSPSDNDSHGEEDEDEEDDEDIASLLKDIQLSNKYKSNKKEDNIAPATFEIDSLLYDPGYTKIYPIYSQVLKNLFSENSINYKLLDFETELKLLFDDLSDELLNEEVESSLPFMKNLKKIIKPWGVKKNGKELVPQGKNLTKELSFSHVMPDFIPTWLPDFQIEKLVTDSYFLENWELERTDDWKELIKEDYKKIKETIDKTITYYKVMPNNFESVVKVNSEFYLNIQLTQDVEAFIRQCRQPTNYYNILFNYQLIQTLIIQSSNIDQNSDRFPEINQLLNRCIFIIDRSLKKKFEFNGLNQLPYNYFYNRIYYLVFLQYIRILNSKGLYRTVGEWCKVLLSLSPLEDPMGVKYFAGDCWIKSLDYHWLIKLSKSAIISKYKEWKCVNILLPTLLAFIRLGDIDGLKKCLKQNFFVTKDDSNMVLKESQYILGWSLKQFLNIATKRSECIEKNDYISDYYIISLELYLQSYDKTWTNDDITKLDNILNKFEILDYNFTPKKDRNQISNAHFIKSIPVNFVRLNHITSNTEIISKLNNLFDKSDMKDYPFDPIPNNISSFEFIEDFTNKKLLSALYEGRLMNFDEFMQ